MSTRTSLRYARATRELVLNMAALGYSHRFHSAEERKSFTKEFHECKMFPLEEAAGYFVSVRVVGDLLTISHGVNGVELRPEEKTTRATSTVSRIVRHERHDDPNYLGDPAGLECG